MTQWFDSKKPYIGILTSKRDNNQLVGNIPLFRAIQEHLLKEGGVSIVFTPDDIQGMETKGAIYDPQKNTWETIIAPLPQLIYNRVPFRKNEETASFKEAVHIFHKNSIPFFNPFFLNKYDCYLLFKDHTNLKEYFLPTIKIEKQTELLKFLIDHRNLYIKRADSSMGKGIHTIQYQENGKVNLSNHNQEIVYRDFEDYWENWSKKFQNRMYIAQPAARPLLYNGKRFDFRILAIFNGVKHKLVGVGVRQSGDQQITTHIPNGGKLLSYSQFQTKKRDLLIQHIVELCGKELNKHYGFFAEFSIDLGITSNGQFIIYEINSKPMKFDEKVIEEKRVAMLCDLFHLYTGNT